MTSDAFGRAIMAYPALLRAYAGEAVTLSPNEALALLDLFDLAENQIAREDMVTPFGRDAAHLHDVKRIGPRRLTLPRTGSEQVAAIERARRQAAVA